jgi:hypothetical protein
VTFFGDLREAKKLFKQNFELNVLQSHTAVDPKIHFKTDAKKNSPTATIRYKVSKQPPRSHIPCWNVG